MIGEEVRDDGAQEKREEEVLTAQERELQAIARQMKSAYLQFCRLLHALKIRY